MTPNQSWTAREVGHGPKLAVRRGRVRPEELAGGVLVEVSPHQLALLRGELGAVTADAAIDQGGDAAVAVEATPVQEAGAAAAGNLDNLGDGIAGAVEAHGLVAGAGGAVFGAVVRAAQLGGLRVG